MLIPTICPHPSPIHPASHIHTPHPVFNTIPHHIILSRTHHIHTYLRLTSYPHNHTAPIQHTHLSPPPPYTRYPLTSSHLLNSPCSARRARKPDTCTAHSQGPDDKQETPHRRKQMRTPDPHAPWPRPACIAYTDRPLRNTPHCSPAPSPGMATPRYPCSHPPFSRITQRWTSP